MTDDTETNEGPLRAATVTDTERVWIREALTAAGIATKYTHSSEDSRGIDVISSVTLDFDDLCRIWREMHLQHMRLHELHTRLEHAFPVVQIANAAVADCDEHVKRFPASPAMLKMAKEAQAAEEAHSAAMTRDSFTDLISNLTGSAVQGAPKPKKGDLN